MRSSSVRRFILPVLVVFALVAGACSGSSSANRGAAAAGNPVDLAALPAGTGNGERVPAWFGAEVTPTSWVSTSLSPTLVVPGASGAWTFKLSDLSDGTSAFGTRTYAENGNSTRVPAGLLNNGDTYMWIAESPGQQPVSGSFTVDVQMLDAQRSDSAGGVDALLSSGEAAYLWSSHTMQSLGGVVGVSLRFQASNASSPGVPAGWKLTTSSGSPYSAVVLRADGSAGLVSKNGQVSSYRPGTGSSWNPVKMAGDGLNTAGLAPVLIRNADGSWSVTSKSSTSRFVDDNGDGTSDLAGLSADGAPSLQQEWAGGLLRKITDPVSGRSVELIYGGGSCPKPVAGFVAAPEGMLCQVKFWDGSTSAFSYVALSDGSVSIGRLTDFPEAGADGAQVFDVAYDAAGRIARTRSPLVASAAASSIIDPGDSQYWTEVAYSTNGRVESFTDAASSSGSERCVRSFANEGSFTTVADSCLGKVVSSIIFDGTTFFPLEVTDILGRTASYRWNLATGDLLSSIDETGRVTANEYAEGNLIRTTGPSRDLSTAQIGLRQYDETYADSPEGVSMRGLDVVYWPSATDRGPDAVQELGPTTAGSLRPSLTINWDKSPAGNGSGGWSGLMNGALSITTPGAYTFASGSTNAKLRVANLACENGGCTNVDLPAGQVSIRVEIESQTQQSSIDLTWSGPDTGGTSQSIPTDRLRPQYGFATETKIVDPTAIRSNVDSISRSVYAEPAKGLVTGRINGAGAVSAITYDGKGWNRPSGSVLPAGNKVRQEWWGDKESATAPCSGAKGAVQGGAIKTTVTPGPSGGDGPSVQQWYTASGQLAASKLSGGATSCLTYDKAGRILRGENLGLGEKSIIEMTYAIDGNPLVSTITETEGATVSTSTIETDLAGRAIRSVDRNGIVTLTTYDRRTGEAATTTSTPPGGAPVVTTYGFDEFGRPTTTTIDGRLIATIVYGQFGLPTTVNYGNGATTVFTVDAQNRVTAATMTSGARTWSSSRVLSAAGITSSATLTAEGKSSTFNYSHDDSGRLSAVTLSAGLVADARSWAYAYDANSNRTSQTATVGGTTTQYSYTYDKADRLVSTTDPGAGDIVYDERGNATRVGPDSFTYDAANLLLSATDGSTTVTYQRAASGAVIGKSTTDAKGTTNLRFGAAGFVLDDQGRATAQMLSLPGSVKLTRRIGTTPSTEWAFTTISGDRFVTLDDAGAPIGSVSVFNPFGERILGTPVVDASQLDLTWKAAEGNETIALRTPIVAMGQRVYVPSLGRFIQVDPVVGGSANGYDYGNQDPTSSTDPSGNADSSVTDWLGLALVAVASIGAGLLMPVNAGRGFSMLLGAGVGVLAAGINAVVQYNGSDGATFVPLSLVVGVLGGIAGGGIGFKVKMARLAKSSGGMGNYAAESGGTIVAKAPQASAKASTRPMAIRPQPTVSATPQVIKVKPVVDQPPPIKVAAHQRKVRFRETVDTKVVDRWITDSWGDESIEISFQQRLE